MRVRPFAICLLCVLGLLLVGALSGCAGKGKSGSAETTSEGGKPTTADQSRMKGGMPPGGPGEKGQ